MPSRAPTATDRRTLALLLALALALRIAAARTPGFHHPDAIYQYLEPAQRLLSGEGVVTWEWRAAARGWLLPMLLTAPLGLARALAPAGDLDLVLPRVAMGIASLGIVWAAYRLGRRRSASAALLGGFVAATWFECVYFGVQTLAEPIATAAFLVGTACLGTADAKRSGDAAAGLWLGLAAVLRPHYAIACAIVALPVILGRRPRLVWLAIGAAVALAVAGIADGAQGAVPLRWVLANVEQNIGGGRAASFGVAPPGRYLLDYALQWQWMIPAIAIGAAVAARREAALLVAAAATVALHSLIGHKEYRFVFLATATVVVVAAIGWGVLLDTATAGWPRWRRRAALALVMALWAVGSASLWRGDQMRDFRDRGRAETLIAAALRGDPAACGIALVESPVVLAGSVTLRPDQRLFLLPLAPGGASATAGAGFNRVVAALPRHAAAIPPGYRTTACAPSRGGRLCLLARPGSCTARPGDPLAIDAALARAGL